MNALGIALVWCAVQVTLFGVSVHFAEKTGQNRRVNPSFFLPHLRSKRKVTRKLLLTRQPR